MALDPRLTNDDVPDEVELTHYGRQDSGFKNRPAPGQVDISLLAGRLSIEDATRAVAGRQASHQDGVRHTTAGALRAEGFIVSYTPTKKKKGHVSAYREAAWSGDVCEALDQCFTEPQWTEVEG